jgi:hypothetical protein
MFDRLRDRKPPVSALTREGNSYQVDTQSRLGELTGLAGGQAVAVGWRQMDRPRTLPSAQLNGGDGQAVMVAGGARGLVFPLEIVRGTASGNGSRLIAG